MNELESTMSYEAIERLSLTELKELSRRSNAHRKPETQAAPVLRRREERQAPLSFAQERLWVLEQLGFVGTSYNMPFAFRVLGELNVAALERSFQELIRRHEILRTRFQSQSGQPVQVVDEKSEFTVRRVDLSDEVRAEREELAHRMIREEAERPFDLETGPLLRVLVITQGPREHTLLLNLHHIICDGWSLGVINSEIVSLYEAYSGGRAPELPSLPIQYADYASWQREVLCGKRLDELLIYWRNKLAGAPDRLALPADRPHPDVASFKGALYSFEIPASVHVSLEELAKRNGASLFMVILGTLGVLLSRYSGQTDLVIGSGVAARTHAKTEGLIGFFVNMLVLRLQFSDNPSFSSLLAQAKEVTLNAYAHQDLPFATVVKELRPERNLSRQPLFQVALFMQNYPYEPMHLSGITWTPLEVEQTSALFDLTLHVYVREEGLTCVFEYATDIFDRHTVVRMGDHFRVLLDAVARDPDARVEQYDVLPEVERQQVIHLFNATQADYPKDKLIHELFEEQVQRTPEAVAVVYEEKSLTYAELNAKANQLAWYLRGKGVGPDHLVGICVERSLEMMVGLLGILKAGGAYMPLDPGYPAERLIYMLEDAKPHIVLTQDRVRGRLADPAVPVVTLDRDSKEIASQPASNPPRCTGGFRSEQLAYVLYTSGSTGRPKGVGIEHRSTVNLIHWATSTAGAGEFDHTLFSTSLNFDLSVYECFVPLSIGGTVHVVQNALSVVASRVPVTLVNTVPSVIKAMLESGGIPESVRVINLAGEPLRDALVARIFEASSVESVRNLYAPSETTTYSTGMPMSRHERVDVSIGKPIWNTQIYILNPHGQPVPIGVAGEIYIGGAGVARGYLNRPELTAERFLADPFSADAQARMYKTGDLGRWRADGTIEYLGRNDHQVKIRGFRIELGEIEAQLTGHGEVKEAVVLAREDVPGDKRLVAYVVPAAAGQTPSVETLRGHLKGVLPEYMVPSAFVVLERLPLTPNGKLDRRALPAPELSAYVSREYEAPVGEVEEILAGIWQSLLNVERVGRNDNFFELGGHSLTGLRLISKIFDHLAVRAPVVLVFKHPTVELMAKAIEPLRGQVEKMPHCGVIAFEEVAIPI